MEKIILFNSTATEKRAVVLEGGKPLDFVVERPDSFRILGNIYRGRITSVIPGIQSAFVDVGIEQSAFLHASDVHPSLLLEADDDRIERLTNRGEFSKRRSVVRVPIEDCISEGQDILIQVSKEPIGNKSPKVTTQISIAGRFVVVVPDSDFIGVSKKSNDFDVRKQLKNQIAKIKPKGIGIILRTIGLKVSEKELLNEMKTLLEQWRYVQNEALKGSGPKLILKESSITTQVIRDLFSDDVTQVIVDQRDDYDQIMMYLKSISPELCNRVQYYQNVVPLFDKYHVENELEKSLKRKVWLKSGGYLFIDRTEALWAIDINTGRNVGKKDLEETVFNTNMEAVNEIGKQLRLRDIGGLIVVDFIDMKNPKNRHAVENEMKKVLEKDPTTTSCTNLSKFSLMEITRKRVRPELQEMFTDICHTCNGLGRVFSPATVTSRIERWLRRATLKSVPRKLILAIPESVASYITQNQNKIIVEFCKVYQLDISVKVDFQMEEDEFEFIDISTKQIITDMYNLA